MVDSFEIEDLKMQRLRQLDRVVESGKLSQEEIEFCNKNYMVGLAEDIEVESECIIEVAAVCICALILIAIGYIISDVVGSIIITAGVGLLFGGNIFIGSKNKRNVSKTLKRLNEIYSKADEHVE